MLKRGSILKVASVQRKRSFGNNRIMFKRTRSAPPISQSWSMTKSTWVRSAKGEPGAWLEGEPALSAIIETPPYFLSGYQYIYNISHALTDRQGTATNTHEIRIGRRSSRGG